MQDKNTQGKKYKVLVPNWHFAGYNFDNEAQFTVSWKVKGYADSMQEAKKIVPCPVLEEV